MDARKGDTRHTDPDPESFAGPMHQKMGIFSPQSRKAIENWRAKTLRSQPQAHFH
jgi:hypothetical protein